MYPDALSSYLVEHINKFEIVLGKRKKLLEWVIPREFRCPLSRNSTLIFLVLKPLATAHFLSRAEPRGRRAASRSDGIRRHRVCVCVCARVHASVPASSWLQASCTPPRPVSTGGDGCGESGVARPGRTLRSPGPSAAPRQPSHSYQGPGGSRSCFSEGN